MNGTRNKGCAVHKFNDSQATVTSAVCGISNQNLARKSHRATRGRRYRQRVRGVILPLSFKETATFTIQPAAWTKVAKFTSSQIFFTFEFNLVFYLQHCKQDRARLGMFKALIDSTIPRVTCVLDEDEAPWSERCWSVLFGCELGSSFRLKANISAMS